MIMKRKDLRARMKWSMNRIRRFGRKRFPPYSGSESNPNKKLLEADGKQRRAGFFVLLFSVEDADGKFLRNICVLRTTQLYVPEDGTL
jgi:hypothetical protein